MGPNGSRPLQGECSIPTVFHSHIKTFTTEKYSTTDWHSHPHTTCLLKLNLISHSLNLTPQIPTLTNYVSLHFVQPSNHAVNKLLKILVLRHPWRRNPPILSLFFPPSRAFFFFLFPFYFTCAENRSICFDLNFCFELKFNMEITEKKKEAFTLFSFRVIKRWK